MTVGKLKTEFKSFLTVRIACSLPHQKKTKTKKHIASMAFGNSCFGEFKAKVGSCAGDVFSVVPLNSRAGPF